MEKEGNTPAPSGDRMLPDELVRGAWLSHGLDEQPRILVRAEQALERKAAVAKGEADPVPVGLEDPLLGLEVRPLDGERRIGIFGLEVAGDVDRVDDRAAEAASGLEDAGHLDDRRLRVVEVHDGHVCDYEIEGAVLEGQLGRVGDLGGMPL